MIQVAGQVVDQENAESVVSSVLGVKEEGGCEMKVFACLAMDKTVGGIL